MAKMELTIFHRYDTSTAETRGKIIVVKSLPVLKVLGMLFKNQMQWDMQVEKVIPKTRRSLQGLKIIKRHVTKTFNIGHFNLLFKVVLQNPGVVITDIIL